MKTFLILLFALLVTNYGHAQRSYNYSRRYTSTMQHVSNKVAMKKALKKKQNSTTKQGVQSPDAIDSTRKQSRRNQKTD